MENTKAWWKSKTVWVNLLAALGCIAGSYGMDSRNWAEITAVSLAFINIVLRFFTNSELDSGNPSN